MTTAFLQYANQLLPQDAILRKEPMAKHTTFRLGGPADCMVAVQNIEQLAKILSYIVKAGLPYFLLGNGSNLLVGDKGYRGIVLRLAGEFTKISVEENCILAGAGALLSKTAQAAKEHSLAGLEFASGIPGTVGGAIVMNAGAYGGEMKQVVRLVRVMTQTGEILELDNETMEFAYRKSVVKNRPYIVLDTRLELAKGEAALIAGKMEELAAERRKKQPLEYASAGSTFQRPEGYFAGKLIMDAGLRGCCIGGAQVAEKHCGFIINKGNASAADVAELITEVAERVKERFGVTLVPEVIRLGDF